MPSHENANSANVSPSTNLFQKLTGFQAIIPQFDNNSAVTPKFFIDTLDNITDVAGCSDNEKLLIAKSRIRGDALSHIINSPDLSQETTYTNFKTKFLNYFNKKTSLASRQQQFTNCRMLPGENAHVYAARVSNATNTFFGEHDLTIPQVKALVEESKLSKFLDGLLPQYKQQTLLKDPQTFQDALNFVELLQTNQITTPTNDNTINNISGNSSSQNDLLKVIESHSQMTHETVAALTKEIEQIKLNMHKPSHTPWRGRSFQNNRQFRSPRPNNTTFRPHNQNSFFNNARSFNPCIHCGLDTHLSRNCENSRQNTYRSNPSDFTRSSRPFYPTHNSRNTRGRSVQFNRSPLN